MADIAELGLKLNADGMVVGVRRVRTELTTLGTEGGKVQTRVQSFARESAFAISSLASSGTRDLTTVAKSLSNVGFAFGVQAGIITLAVSAIADAFAEEWAKVRAENEKFLEHFLSFEKRFGEAALRIRIAALEARRDQMAEANIAASAALGPAGAVPAWSGNFLDDVKLLGRKFMKDMGFEQASEFDNEIQSINNRLHETRLRLTELGRQRVGKQIAEDLKQATDAAREFAEDGLASFDREFDATMRRAMDAARQSAQEDREFAAAREEEFKRFLDQLDEVGRKLEKNDAKSKQWRDTLNGMVAGVFSGALQGAGAPLGGALGGIIGAASSGASGFGIAAAGVQGLVGDLFNLGKSAQQAREHIRQMNAAFVDWMDAIKVELGVMSSLDAKINQITREHAGWREALEKELVARQKQLQFIDPLSDGYDAVTARIAELQKQLAEVNETEAERTQRLTEEAEALKKFMELERLDEAIGKVQARIASLANTIAGLESFRDSLLMSETRSPADRLAEAQRQYDEILSAANGSDVEAAQAAAGRLPAAAQALLDAARVMFGSGADFQSIFQQTLADTQNLIDRFGVLQSIEEQQLAELQRIRAATELGVLIQEQLLTGQGGSLGTVGGSGGQGGSGGGPGGSGTDIIPMANVMAASAKGQIRELEMIRAELALLRKDMRTAVGGLTS